MTHSIFTSTIEDLTRRELMFGALGTALLIACGDDDAEADPAATTTPSALPRTVTHKMGSAEIPAEPQRIAALNEGEALDHLLAVGITPVLYGQTPGYDGKGVLGPWARDAAPGELTSYEAARGEPDLERFAAAAPDLIVGAWTSEEQFGLLSAIAPTVIVKVSDATAWPEMQRIVGQATGREAQAESALAETEAVITANAERLKHHAGRKVMVGYKFFEELYHRIHRLPGSSNAWG
jgi:iron complex transport system substrate-binding protein